MLTVFIFIIRFIFDINMHATINDYLYSITRLESVVDYPCFRKGDSKTSLTYTKQYSVYLDWHQLILSNMASFHFRHFFSWVAVYLSMAFSEAFFCHAGKLPQSYSCELLSLAVAAKSNSCSFLLIDIGRLSSYPIHNNVMKNITRTG